MFNLLEAAPNTVIGNIIVVSGAFVILIVLLRLFAWKSITGIFEQRAKKISDDIDAAQEANQKATALVEQRASELASSKADAATIIQSAHDTAEKNRRKVMQEANEAANATKERAHAEIEQGRREALDSVKGDVAELSVKIAEKLIGQSLDEKAQSDLIDSYLAELGK